ncbi:aminoglycoside phosphotransferase family protein [Amycolatopsis sp. NBC_01480]
MLRDACDQAGIDARGAEPIRLGENAILRLPGGIVARIARSGQHAAAAREVRIARWLADHDIPAVRALDDLGQPIEAHGHGDLLARAARAPQRHPRSSRNGSAPAARPARRQWLAPVLRAGAVRPARRTHHRRHQPHRRRPPWLHHHLATLRDRYDQLPAGLPHTVLHGDAWVGNVVATNDNQVVLLDLERASIGPPEWDLVSTAIKHTSFAWITAADYRDFCHRYGHDVTTWDGFALLRDIRELRMTCYLAQHAAENPRAQPEAGLRVTCLRGRNGPRPWSWSPAS